MSRWTREQRFDIRVLIAVALLILEDVLSGWTEHWQVILGPLLILSVVFFRRGPGQPIYHVGIYLKDGNGNYLLANQAMADLFGLTPEELRCPPP